MDEKKVTITSIIRRWTCSKRENRRVYAALITRRTYLPLLLPTRCQFNVQSRNGVEIAICHASSRQIHDFQRDWSRRNDRSLSSSSSSASNSSFCLPEFWHEPENSVVFYATHEDITAERSCACSLKQIFVRRSTFESRRRRRKNLGALLSSGRRLLVYIANIPAVESRERYSEWDSVVKLINKERCHYYFSTVSWVLRHMALHGTHDASSVDLFFFFFV